jgi:hypothetical protein
MLAPSHVYLVGIDALAANTDDERLNVIGTVLAAPVSICGRPMLVMTAVVSGIDDLDFPQATAKERRTIVRRLRRSILRSCRMS